MGARPLNDWLLSPLADRREIEARLEAVAELLDGHGRRADLRDNSGGVFDLQRLTARVSTGRASPRDLLAVARTLGLLPRIKALLDGCQAPLLTRSGSAAGLVPGPARRRCENALVDEPPLSPREGGLIRQGYDPDLDECTKSPAAARSGSRNSRPTRSAAPASPSLKVGYNQVFGYYIEITNTHQAASRRTISASQTLKNAERYITPELKEYEEKILTATEKLNQREYELFLDLRDRVAAQHAPTLADRRDAGGARRPRRARRTGGRAQLLPSDADRSADPRHPRGPAPRPRPVAASGDARPERRSAWATRTAGSCSSPAPTWAARASTYARWPC